MKNSSKPLKITPLPGYVLIQPEAAEKETQSGIILPESAQQKSAIGIVSAIGDATLTTDGKSVTCPVKVADKVVYKKWSGDELDLEGIEYKLIEFKDLLGILEND